MDSHQDEPLAWSAGHQPVANRPDVVVDFVFDDGLLFISIVNLGGGAAHKVSVVFDPEFRGAGGRPVCSLPLFRNVEYLAPRKAITTFLDSTAEYFRRGEPTGIAVRITYSDGSAVRYETTISHDLEIYRDIAYVVGRPKLSGGMS